MKCSDEINVTNDKRKQEIIIADNSALSKISLWEENIGKLEAGKSYKLENFMVREYASEKFLSMGREGSRIEAIADIGDIKDDGETSQDEDNSLANATGFIPLVPTMQSKGGTLYATSWTVL